MFTLFIIADTEDNKGPYRQQAGDTEDNNCNINAKGDLPSELLRILVNVLLEEQHSAQLCKVAFLDTEIIRLITA